MTDTETARETWPGHHTLIEAPVVKSLVVV